MRRLAFGLAAALAGASGMGLQALFLSAAGLALGYGGSTAIGLAAYLAAWSLGAFVGGRARVSVAVGSLGLGLALAVLALPLLALLLAAGGALASSALCAPLALLAIGLVAALQGAWLPLLARADARAGAGDVALLWAANFAGSLAGAAWIADAAVGAFGLFGAAAWAGAAALAAGSLGFWASGRPPERASKLASDRRLDRTPDHELGRATRSEGSTLSFARATWIVGFVTAWMSAVEWIGLRLGVLWLGGMQPALSGILCASVLALALGAALVPRCVPRSPRGVVVVLALAALGSLWPLLAPAALHALARAIGAATPDPNMALERIPLFVRAFVLVGPSLVAFGGLVPVLHRALAASMPDSGARLGRLLLHESWGAAIGIPLVHFWIVPSFGLSVALACAIAVGALALLVARTAAPRLAPGCAVAALGGALFAATRSTPALLAPPLSNPALRVLALTEDRDFAVAVVDDGLIGERTLLTDGFRAAGTGRDYLYMQALGHLPLLLHPAPKRVAVLALGTGTTVGAVAQHPEVERIDVLEISRAVVADAAFFETKNGGALRGARPDSSGLAAEAAAEPRVVVRLGDGRQTLARSTARYDVITMEPLLPDSPFAVYLYTREFYARAKAALAPGGLVCQWVPPHALEPSTFEAVLDAFARSFPWSGVWLYGTQVVLVGGERMPELSGERFQRVDAVLAKSLVDLGLSTPADVLARWCGTVVSSGDTLRALTDADPWIVYRPRRSGVVLLADLPRNLERVAALGSEPPASWLASAGPEAEVRRLGGRALRAAQLALALDEAHRRGAVVQAGEGGQDLQSALSLARELASRDPELARLEDQVAFLRDLRAGVSALAADATSIGAQAALDPLLSAAERRKERADVHLYLAVALDRLGSAAADKALDAALQRCPRIALTNEGRRALSLGLSAVRSARLEDAARGAP